VLRSHPNQHEKIIRKYLANSGETSIERHYPGMNYMGPGTHIIANIANDVKPTSYVDALALKHDLDYLFDKEPIQSDLKAIAGASIAPGLQSMAMIAGLALRSGVDAIGHLVDDGWLHINGRTDTLTVDDATLRQEITPLANHLLNPFNLNFQ